MQLLSQRCGNTLSMRLPRALPVLGLLVFWHVDRCPAQEIGLQLVEAQQSALAAQSGTTPEAATLPPPTQSLALPKAQPTPRMVRSARAITLSSAAAQGDMPKDLSEHLFTNSQQDAQQTRGWEASAYDWEASKLCHNTLYFQQVAAERYGQTICPCVQPVISVGRFYGDFVALPVQMAMTCPSSCQYAYGYFRPGSPAPCASSCAR